MKLLNLLVSCALVCLLAPPTAPAAEFARVSLSVSLILDRTLGEPAQHGVNKLKQALAAREVTLDEARGMDAAHDDLVVVAGLPGKGGAAAELMKSMGLAPLRGAESVLIRHTEWKGKPLLLVSGSDETGLMYSLLELADRVGWARDNARPFSEVRDVTESPSVAERAVTIFTMQRAQFENRLHDENYWSRYLDTLARDRFNEFQVLFAYETDGYMCPAYPYFVNVEQFPDVRVAGLTAAEQARNLSDLNRLIRMAHQRGIKVTIGLWCHYYRFSSTWETVSHDKPADGRVWGLSEQNLIPYTEAAFAKFLKAVPDMDKIMLLMHGESGLKTEDMKVFWDNFYQVMKREAPHLPFELRAKGVSDDLLEHALSLGLKIRVNTKYWAEQVGLPFHPTHIQELNQFERRHGYSDMLKYPRDYQLHWTLWTSGTTRMLLWGDPDYVRRFAGSTHLGGAQGFDIMEPLATKMAGHPHDMQPFELLNPAYRYYDYEFERYWHFFQVFGRLTYNPGTPSEEWDREFEKRFGQAAAPYVEQGLHRASQILPRIVAYCLPPNHFPTTRGWPERQRQEDLPEYAHAEPSDLEQFQSLAEAARNLVEGVDSARIAPMATSRWFAAASKMCSTWRREAEQAAGPNPGREFLSTMVDLKILANLALYHSRRIPAGLSYALYERTHDLNALDDAIAGEKRAMEAWEGIVRAAGDVYHADLMMGLAEFDLSGHWKDELVKLKAGVARLERERTEFRAQAAREIGRYDLGAGPLRAGYQRLPRGESGRFETNGSNLVVLPVPEGRYRIEAGIEDPQKSHGPMWIEVNGTQYSDVFTVPAGQRVERSLETSAVDGKIKVLFDHATSVDWYASTLTVTRVDPLIAHVPVRKLRVGQDLVLRATVSGAAPITVVRAFAGDAHHGYAEVMMEGGGPNLYRAVIPASKVWGGISYFLEAVDSAGRSAIWPENGRDHPVPVRVTGDGQPPVLRHTPILTAQPGKPLRIVAEAQNPSGILWVRLRYRGLSQHQDFRTLTMLPTGNGGEYEATIPGGDIDPKFDLMYLFEVMDHAGNGKIYPDLERETPYVVVKVEGGGQAAGR